MALYAASRDIDGYLMKQRNLTNDVVHVAMIMTIENAVSFEEAEQTPLVQQMEEVMKEYVDLAAKIKTHSEALEAFKAFLIQNSNRDV
jgi:alkyl hydroperoxide reductase subunit AhpF